ncbi:Dehydrogenase (flavoprotein) [Amycolatopsis arida]|uniref:Dehydrogenase (Flavoprotein) n=1 Tax=Amycolatopsis arida TaxID=587909 RepID=A0A1I6AKT2_9PSEU|nr:FAD-dependent oxidoreductase [Amycolatopsis arida]TDX87354.1 flavin-dependent dehydrogenase [Amycolatopsis arida]SFQ69240.1 Dehydrogenase (flavoprotein) [Amycolatopsis arida]
MATPIAVVGAGVAGLCTALLLARQGRDVDLLDRDTPPPDELAELGEWQRPGTPQAQHPHVYLGLFRRLLRENLPDVHGDLLAGGIEELPFSGNLPGAEEDLVMMAARRSTLEWALHRALRKEHQIRYRPGVSVQAVEVAGGRVRGLRTARGVAEYDVVVDATGARSRLAVPFRGVVAEAECGKVYNTRFYRLRPGVPRPPLRYGSVTVVDGLGYGAALFCHDLGYFSIDIGRLPEDETLKRLRDPDAFERVVALFAAFRPWTEHCAPVGEVVPMAGLRNVLYDLADDAPVGYFPVGDTVCVTDPTFGRGMALALAQAVPLARALAAGGGGADLNRRTTAAAVELTRPWFDDVVLQDRARTALWRAAVAGRPWQDLLPGMPPNPFLMIDAEDRDPELGLLGRRYVSMLHGTLDTADVRRRIAAVADSPAPGQAPAHAPSYPAIVEALAG